MLLERALLVMMPVENALGLEETNAITVLRDITKSLPTITSSALKAANQANIEMQLLIFVSLVMKLARNAKDQKMESA